MVTEFRVGTKFLKIIDYGRREVRKRPAMVNSPLNEEKELGENCPVEKSDRLPK